jgi:hypothetical protein
MPSQQRLRRNDGSHFSEETPAQQFRLRRQSATLVIAQAKPPAAQLIAPDAVLLSEIIDDLQLVLIHPAGRRHQQEPERIQRLQHRIAHYRL